MAGLDLSQSSAVAKHYSAAVLDCNQALDLQPMCAKAHYRKAMALECMWALPQGGGIGRVHLGSLEAALASARLARSHAPVGMQKACDQMAERLGRELAAACFDEVD